MDFNIIMHSNFVPSNVQRKSQTERRKKGNIDFYLRNQHKIEDLTIYKNIILCKEQKGQVSFLNHNTGTLLILFFFLVWQLVLFEKTLEKCFD